MAQQQLESQTASTIAVVEAFVVEAFNEAFNRHDVDAIMNAMTDDSVFEDTDRFRTVRVSRVKWRCEPFGSGFSVLHPRRISKPKIYSPMVTVASGVGYIPGWMAMGIPEA